MNHQDKCSTTAEHLNLSCYNAKWSHPERAERGQKGYGALYLPLGLINMEARTVVNNLEWKIEGSRILQPLNTEINVPICPGLCIDLIFEYIWHHMYGNASKTLLCALSSRSFCQGFSGPTIFTWCYKCESEMYCCHWHPCFWKRFRTSSLEASGGQGWDVEAKL